MLGTAACGDNATFPPKRDPAAPAALEPLACLPNLDGVIEAGELAPAIGVTVHYLASPPAVERVVDLVGATGGDGRTHWDFATDYADDQAFTVTPASVAGHWYASSFPADAFVTSYDPAGTLDSIGRATGAGLELLGIASHVADPPEGQTLLVYQTPVRVLPYPVAEGPLFVSVGQIVNGTVRGLPYAGRDTYEVEVDGIGSIDTPQLTFTEVHRVHTRVTVEPAVGATVTRQQVSFFAECFAEVARATSLDDEPAYDFTRTSELRRFGL
ncbi:MAG: hypothetical protein HY908_00060 [Myxococcales bacterium]|nr:hypothetical protein [Myxococcales bacterium]